MLGTRDFRDKSRCHMRVRRPQIPPEIIVALFYTKINENILRRCTYPPFWSLGISGTRADIIFVFGGLKKPSEIIFALLYSEMNKTSEEDAHTRYPGHQVFPGSKPMSYSYWATSNTPEIIVALFYTKINEKFLRRYTYPPFWALGISGTGADILFVFGDLKKHSEIVFALLYSEMNTNSRRRRAYPPSWAHGISGIKADAIFVLGNLKYPQK